MARFTGLAGTATASFMDELKRRREMQLKEQERERRKKQFISMLEGMGMPVPQTGVPEGIEGQYMNYQADLQQKAKEKQMTDRRNQIIGEFMRQQYPDLAGNLPPDTDWENEMANMIMSIGKRREEEKQRQIQEEQLHRYAAQIGIPGHENLGGEALATAIENYVRNMRAQSDFQNDLAKMKIGAEQEREYYDYRQNRENPRIDTAEMENYVRGVHASIRTPQQMIQVKTNDPIYQEAMDFIMDSNPGLYSELKNEQFRLMRKQPKSKKQQPDMSNAPTSIFLREAKKSLFNPNLDINNAPTNRFLRGAQKSLFNPNLDINNAPANRLRPVNWLISSGIKSLLDAEKSLFNYNKYGY